MKNSASNYIQVYRHALNNPTHSPKNAALVILTLCLLLSELYVVKIVKDSKQYSGYNVSAASPDQLEAEDAVLGGNTSIVNDPNASGGKYVVFNANSPTPTNSPTSGPNPTSPPTSSTRGPRPAPAKPTGSNVYTVPASYVDDGSTDRGPAITSWLNTLPANSIVVFAQDNPQGRVTGKDAAITTYRTNLGIKPNRPLTLWGYGARILVNSSPTSASEAGVYLAGSANDGTKILGFEIDGPMTVAATTRAWSGESGERPHGISLLGAVKDIEMADLWIHDVHGDAIYKPGGATVLAPPAGGYWIHHNLLERTGRQGIVTNVGVPTAQHDYGWLIEFNTIRDIALQPIDGEDSRTTGNRLEGLYIRDNDIYRYNWEGTTTSFNNNCHAIGVIYTNNSSEGVYLLGEIRDVEILRNKFGNYSQGGGACMGFGGDLGPQKPAPQPDSPTIRFRLGYNHVSTPKINMTIRDNVWDVGPKQQTQPWLHIWNCTNVTVTNNDVPSAGAYRFSSCNPTMSGNQ